MQYRSFGQSGLKTSQLAIGTWKNMGERLELSATRALFCLLYTSDAADD